MPGHTKKERRKRRTVKPPAKTGTISRAAARKTAKKVKRK